MRRLDTFIDTGLPTAINQLEKLILPLDVSEAAPVRSLVALLDAAGVPVILSNNPSVFGCENAARNRRSMGHTGVALERELKSYLGIIQSPGGEPIAFMAHCRADRKFNFEAIKKALGTSGEIKILIDNETDRPQKGLIHPFLNAIIRGNKVISPYIQIFDNDIFKSPTTPPTMTTNAGARTVGMEIDPRDLFNILTSSVKADITEGPTPSTPTRLSNGEIAIIGGNPLEALTKFAVETNQQIRLLLGEDNHGDISMPHYLLSSLPSLGLTMELDTRRNYVWRELRKNVLSLLRQKPRILAIACNTTPYFTEQIQDLIEDKSPQTTLITPASATIEFLQETRPPQVTLLGIPYVSSDRTHSAFITPLENLGIEVISPDQWTLNKLEALARDVKKGGKPGVISHNNLRDLALQIRSDVVIVALTELSDTVKSARPSILHGKQYIDTMELMAQKVAAALLKQPFPHPPQA